MRTIQIAADFTPRPGPRYRSEGPNSGQQFREELLEPAFKEVSRSNEKILIQLDGARYGYPTSFLEEAFGGLARIYGISAVQERFIFESADEPLLDTEIRTYINDCNKPKRTPSVKRD